MGDDTLDPINWEPKYSLPGMLVYLVTEGEDDNCSIAGVFSTKAKAQKFIGNNTGPDHVWSYYQIEEELLDEREYDVLRTIWACEVSLRTGDIVREWDYERSSREDVNCEGFLITGNKWIRTSISRKHCRKLASIVKAALLLDENDC